MRQSQVTDISDYYLQNEHQIVQNPPILVSFLNQRSLDSIQRLMSTIFGKLTC